MSFIALTVLFFLCANTTYIKYDNGLGCSSSPCYSGSEEISQARQYYKNENGVEREAIADAWLSVTNNILLAPSVVILPLILERISFVVSEPIYIFNIIADTRNEQFDYNLKIHTLAASSETHNMRLGYFLTKLVVLASFPLWFLYAYWCVKLWGKRSWAPPVILGVLCILSAMAFITVQYDGSFRTITWELLLGKSVF